jgi:hypothetical protein
MSALRLAIVYSISTRKKDCGLYGIVLRTSHIVGTTSPTDKSFVGYGTLRKGNQRYSIVIPADVIMETFSRSFLRARNHRIVYLTSLKDIVVIN